MKFPLFCYLTMGFSLQQAPSVAFARACELGNIEYSPYGPQGNSFVMSYMGLAALEGEDGKE